MNRTPLKLIGILVIIALAASAFIIRRRLNAPNAAAPAQTTRHELPTGFTEQRIADALNSPTTMAIAPDGRIFIAQQGGKIRIVKDDRLIEAPFYAVPTASYDEQGLSGLTFDPDFLNNGFVYLTYSAADGNNQSHQRISRLTANGDAGSDEVVLFELPRSRIEYHLAGALQFGPDGKLYMVTGEGVGNDVQSLTDFAGKILRLNPDGSIPTDNPFCHDASNKLCSIWALGFRNPYVFQRRPDSDHFYLNDVGDTGFEEINDAVRGGNYGYPLNEGVRVNPGQLPPIHAYPHLDGDCAIVGGAFYTGALFPAPYQHQYFFSDYCSGWIEYLDPGNPQSPQMLGIAAGVGLVSLAVDAQGNLYYLARGSTAPDGGSGTGFDTGQLYKISYAQSAAPYLVTQPQSQTISVGSNASFSAQAGGQAPLFYHWQRDGVDIPGAIDAAYTVTQAHTADTNAKFQVVVTNTLGAITSTSATLLVLDNQPPTATITLPPAGFVYTNGQEIVFAGNGTDPESGALPAGQLTWKIELHHDAHTHPFMPTTQGIAQGAIRAPEVPHATNGVFYRIYLIASDGVFSTTVTRDIYPAASLILTPTAAPN